MQISSSAIIRSVQDFFSSATTNLKHVFRHVCCSCAPVPRSYATRNVPANYFTAPPVVHRAPGQLNPLGVPVNRWIESRRLSGDVGQICNITHMQGNQLKKVGKELNDFKGSDLIIGVDAGADWLYARFKKDQSVGLWYRTDMNIYAQPGEYLQYMAHLHQIDRCEVFPVQQTVSNIAKAASDAAKAFAFELGMKGTIGPGGDANTVIGVNDLAAHIRSEATRHQTGTGAADFQRLEVVKLEPGSPSDAIRVGELAASVDRLLIGSEGYFWVLHKAPYEADVPLADDNAELTRQWRGKDDQWALYDMQKDTAFRYTQSLPDFMLRLHARGFGSVEIAYLPPQENASGNAAATQQGTGNAFVPSPDPVEGLAALLSGNDAPSDQDRLIAGNLADLIWSSS